MNAAWLPLLEEACAGAERTWAGWDRASFDRVALPAIERLVQGLKASDPEDVRLVRSYMELMVEGSAQGYFQGCTGQPWQERWPNLLSHLMIQLVPWRLKGDVEEPVELLAEAWNLGEGLLGEPAWVNQVVAAQASTLWTLDDLEGWLTGVLTPLLTPVEPAAWAGPFLLTELDLTEQDDTFLPGALTLVAPSLVCVRDRLDRERCLAVLLQREGESCVVGETAELGGGPGDARVEIATAPGVLRVGGEAVVVPAVQEWHGVLATQSGFVVGVAEDSQRLWVVESP